MSSQSDNRTTRKLSVIDRITTLLVTVLVAAAVLAAAAAPIVRVVDALLPLIAVAGVLAITWKVVDYLTRR